MLGKAGADEHAVGAVLAQLDGRAERVELGELRALVVGHEELDHLEPVANRSAIRVRSSSRPSPVAAEPGPRRGTDCEPPACERVDAVDLVQDELDGQLVRTDLREHVIDRGDHLPEPLLGSGGIGHVQHEVGDERLLERRGEALDELMRQSADEADRVRNEVAPPVVLERARRRVEGLEQAVLDRDLGARERIEQRRLADVRVAGERDGRRLRARGATSGACRAAAQLASGGA